MTTYANTAESIANTQVFYELISLFAQLANTQDINLKVAANMVKIQLEEIQFLPNKLAEFAKTNPVIPGVTTPIDWAAFPGLSEKAIELAQKLVKDRKRPAVLVRQASLHNIDNNEPVQENQKQRKLKAR